ncbi:WXG100 family type VII secretion target [Kitasatospora sp. NPDC101176]|uniref:WXG100 family type VII secretion target n=1 Tax=Kitasatospora sp. NPDC101176 TaxID=3364099 RepID=UPI0037F96734
MAGSPGGPLFGVNPADLDAAAKVAKDTGEAMPTELKHIHQPSDTAAAALAGWRTGASLHNCTAAWEECLNALASEVDGVAVKLTQTAGNYRGTDTSNAGGLKLPGLYGPVGN